MLFNERDTQTCPMGCNETESTLHHLHCKRQPGALSPKSDLHTVRTWLRHNSTAPPITLGTMQGMTNWTSSLPPPHFPPSTNKKIELLINVATEEQSLIRWEEIFKGRLSSKWSEAQQAWYNSLHRNHCDLDTKFTRHYTGKIWAKQFISRLIYYLKPVANQKRSGPLHRNSRSARKTRTQYTEAITSLYAKQTNHTQLFRMPLADLLSLPTARLFNWLQSHEASTLSHTHTQTLHY